MMPACDAISRGVHDTPRHCVRGATPGPPGRRGPGPEGGSPTPPRRGLSTTKARSRACLLFRALRARGARPGARPSRCSPGPAGRTTTGPRPARWRHGCPRARARPATGWGTPGRPRRGAWRREFPGPSCVLLCETSPTGGPRCVGKPLPALSSSPSSRRLSPRPRRPPPPPPGPGPFALQATLSPAQSTVAAGASVTFAVTVDAPAPDILPVAVTTTGPAGLVDCPGQVGIQAGRTAARLRAKGPQPRGPVAVTATLPATAGGAPASPRSPCGGCRSRSRRPRSRP